MPFYIGREATNRKSGEKHLKIRRKNEVKNMAEETKNLGTDTPNTDSQNTDAPKNDTPTVEELMSQVAQLTADRDKYKSANDKLSKSEAEMKRQLRATLSADEQKKAEEEEAKRLADEERESMRKELNHIKAVNAYKEISDEKVVESLIDAVSDADHSAIATIIANECKKAVEDAEAKWLKNRPQVRNGQYSGLTKEQVMAITDRDERMKAIAMNQHLFK